MNHVSRAPSRKQIKNSERPRMHNRSMWRRIAMAAVLFTAPLMKAQSTTATLSGSVVDPSGAAVADTTVIVTNYATSVHRAVMTNPQGDFSVALLPPGKYELRASKSGFARIEIPNITLNTNDERTLVIKLKVGEVLQAIIVDGSTLGVESSGAVSTVVDSNFVSALPLKGRSFQSLLLMTPGIVNAAGQNGGQEAGQLSVNGLRTNSNYWTVDGVSANAGVASTGGASLNVNQAFTGAIPAFNAFGGTNGMISVDALQEFKVQTADYSAEFGRQPGGQVQLTTRSGSNEFHGVAYDYFRNDKLEANNYFNKYNHPTPIARPKTRLNDFGGTFGGPIVKNRTFFFFSYEGMRYRHPVGDTNTYVPSTALRNDSKIDPNIRALLNAFPTSDQPVYSGNSSLQPYLFYQSSPYNSDSYSLRIDQVINSKWTAFGRFAYAPSNSQTWSLAQLQTADTNLYTGTGGVTGLLTPRLTNQFNFNYTSSGGNGNTVIEPVNGAVVPTMAQLFGGSAPTGAKTTFATWTFFSSSFPSVSLSAGDQTQNANKSLNVIDGLTWAKGKHMLKFGVDFRRLSPTLAPKDYQLGASTPDLAHLEANTFTSVNVTGNRQATLNYDNLSFYAQDAWRFTPRLTLDMGVRWEINPPPSGLDPNDLLYVQGWQNPATMSLAPQGTQAYSTQWHSVAPRLGASYQVHQQQGWETVLRGGFGMFYDLDSAVAGYSIGGALRNASYPNQQVPFSSAIMAPLPPRTYPTAPYPANMPLIGMLNGWSTPTTYEWNTALQQGLGTNQVLTISYVGNGARYLPRSYSLIVNSTNSSGVPVGFSNPNFLGSSTVRVTRNDPGYGDKSDYSALQVKFQRQLHQGLQVLSNYTWAHAIDTASQDTQIFGYLFPAVAPQLTRGNSDNDRRNTVNLALSYQAPSFHPDNKGLRVLNTTFVKGWVVENMLTAQSGVPIDVTLSRDAGGYDVNPLTLHPDMTGQPFWVSDPASPGGKRINGAAFVAPASWTGPVQSVTQGNLPRNYLRTPGIWQYDASIGRDFKLTERYKLQYRAEMFNALNHPNFTAYSVGLGYWSPSFKYNPPSATTYGRATQMLGTNGQGGLLGMIPLFSNGGPRSVQMALKLVF